MLLKDVIWQEFEAILEELGEHRVSKVAYAHGILEIMTPIPEHDRSKETISDLVKAILEELDIEFLSLGYTTFKKQFMSTAIKPDNCFYIQNESAVRGKDKLDLTVDQPRDLAWEIDVTSRTHSNIYEALGVPELWRFEKGKLQINVLEDGKYLESEFTPNFPNLPLTEVIPQYLNRCNFQGRNKTMKAFRAWVREQMQ